MLIYVLIAINPQPGGIPLVTFGSAPLRDQSPQDPSSRLNLTPVQSMADSTGIWGLALLQWRLFMNDHSASNNG